MSSSSSSSDSSSPPPSPQKRKRDDDSEVTDEDSSDSEQSEAEEPQDDEPVLSHAAQRRQKKAAKLAAKKTDEESASKKRKLKEDGSSVPVPANKRQNSVWVGNLSFKTTQADLKKFFADAGEVVRLYMPTKPPPNPSMKPENRGFAYVDFATPEGKTAAIAQSEQPLTGRKLLIKDGDDFTGRPAPAKAEDPEGKDATTASSTTHSKTAQKILKLQKQPPAPTLFIGNLGFETTEENIRELFEAHRSNKGKGKEAAKGADDEDGSSKKDVWIRKIRMGTFEDSGKCKGWAFADFTSIEDATSVLVNPKNHYLNGRKLNIEYASPDAVRRGQPRDKKQDGPRPQRKERPVRDFESRPKRGQPSNTFQAFDDPGMDEAAGPERVEEREFNGRKRNEVAATRGGGKFGRRQRPGAALASATRQSAAIVESRGKKITF